MPAAQGAPAPHAHAPLRQRSAVTPQLPQAAPGAPHAAVLCDESERHWGLAPPEQHPPGHEVALQTHAPPEQVRPAAHAAPVPQRHAPLTQALVAPEQTPQAAPPVPHLVGLWADWPTHAPALQQPLGQLVASHTHAPDAHRWPAAQPPAWVPQAQAPAVHRSAPVQAVHEPPSMPHCAALGLTQVAPMQQPFLQLLESQTQAPATHRWPAAHGARAPH